MDIDGNASGTFTAPSTPGEYPFFCKYHPSMTGIKLNGSLGLTSSGSTLAGLVPTGAGLSIQGQIEVAPKQGEVLNVTVDKKTYKATDARVTIKDVHVKIDGCVGQSFLRSYAVLTSSTADTDDMVAYYGITTVV